MGSHFKHTKAKPTPPVSTSEDGLGALKGRMKDGKTSQERDAWALRAEGLLESFDMADLMKRVMRDACRCV